MVGVVVCDKQSELPMEVKIIVTLVSEAYAGRAVEMNLHTFWVTALASS